ncbi:MAG: hypothetical protein ABW106_11785 [Steroidobacteraceae bacterium]
MRVGARVAEIQDSGNVLAGKIVLGQRVTGTYVYNTNTPNLSPIPALGEYRPYANESRMRFAVGSTVFEAAQPTQGTVIYLNADEFSNGQFLMRSNDNKPLASGALISDITLRIAGQGNVTQSVALPTVAPDLAGYWTKEVVIDGTLGGNSFHVRAVLETAELIVADALTVSPASGSFVANQRFDAALILPRNSSITSMRTTANGQWLPLSYPGSCQLRPQVGTGKPSLVCPSAEVVLGISAGAPVEWTVELTDGTTLTETVDWDIAP